MSNIVFGDRETEEEGSPTIDVSLTVYSQCFTEIML